MHLCVSVAKEVSVVFSWTLLGKGKYHVHTCDTYMDLDIFAEWPSCRREETASFRPEHFLPIICINGSCIPKMEKCKTMSEHGLGHNPCFPQFALTFPAGRQQLCPLQAEQLCTVSEAPCRLLGTFNTGVSGSHEFSQLSGLSSSWMEVWKSQLEGIIRRRKSFNF